MTARQMTRSPADRPWLLRVLRLLWLRQRLEWIEADIRHYQADHPEPNSLQLALWRAVAQEVRVEILLLENTL
jgi:hypothetical protein